MGLFRKAVKSESKLRLALAGPSGSGKTYTALAVATHLAQDGRVALVDTESGSASKYADIFDFDVAEMSAPFHPNKYGKAITEAAAAGYDVIILDSLSHAWNGPGGVLEIVEQASKRFRGNSYAGWQEGTPVHNALIEAIVTAPIHIIGTMRSKTDYILVDKNGKQTPQKVGMAPVQRDGFEYEFDVFIDMDIENTAIVAKTRCPALTGKVFDKPGAELAGILRDWLTGPSATEPIADSEPDTEDNDEAPAGDNGSDVTPDDSDEIKKFHRTAAEKIGYFKGPIHVKHTMNLLGIKYPETTEEAETALATLAQYATLRADGTEKEQAVKLLQGELALDREEE